MDNISFLKDGLFEFLLYKPAGFPYFAAFSMLVACGLGLPIPEDITLFTMGYVAYAGIASFKGSVAVCLVGVLLGDTIIYWIGRKFGVRLAKRGIFARMLPPERMDRTREMFHRMGNKVIFAARFMPGLRAPTYFSAGTLHLPFRVFIFYDGLAALLSVPLLIGVTYFFGEQIDSAVAMARRVQNGIAFLILAIVLLLVAKHYIFKNKRR
ncbi:MAG: DedA family protein [Deltaproteobacteria bacterium]|nr:DedA family protein [Deltaproteobacteria bacterium]